jgi:hypothetical protein
LSIVLTPVRIRWTVPLNYGYCGIYSCEKGSPGGGAGGLYIVLLEDEARPGQGLYMRHHHLNHKHNFYVTLGVYVYILSFLNL